MTDEGITLIGMADIARLARVSRATVGNWKARESDFPAAHSKGSRGPLYNRDVVVTWLYAHDRLASRSAIEEDTFRLLEGFRDDATTSQGFFMILVIQALRADLDDASWQELCRMEVRDRESKLQNLIAERLPLTVGLLPDLSVLANVLPRATEASLLSNPNEFSSSANNLIDIFFFPRGRSEGDSWIPRGVSRLMATLIGPGPAIFDPACGIGRLLVDVAKISGVDEGQAFGQETDVSAGALAQINLLMNRVDATVVRGNAILEDRLPGLMVDRIVTAPPWGAGMEDIEGLEDDPRWIWGPPGRGTAAISMAWLQHCLHHLNEGGRAVVLLPPAVLFQEGASAQSRQRLVKSGSLEAVISLPNGTMNQSNISPVLVCVVKSRPLIAGKPAPILMIDLKQAEYDRPGRRRDLDADTIAKLSTIFKKWNQAIDPVSEFTAAVSYDEITRSGFNLSPQRYVTPREHIDREDLASRREGLRADLEELLQATQRSDAELDRIMKVTRS
jgi:hypothetical protein